MGQRRCRRVRLHGEWWRIVFGPVSKLWGEANWTDRIITVDPTADHSGDYKEPVTFREVAIHEALHAIFPFIDEPYIDRAAKELDEFLEIVDQ